MNIEKIIREAIVDIKSRWTLPTEGFLAGGSLGNLAWEKISSNKAIINDLDIFTYRGKIDDPNNIVYEKFTVKTIEKEIYEDYKGLSVSYRNKPIYIIDSCIRDGIYNTINYLSIEKDPESILESFDINCCEVGYLIEEDKVFYTKNFKKFLETGKLELSNLATPAHSAIRLVKKSLELNVQIPEFELDILTYILDNNFTFDFGRKRFKSKYASLFKKYESYLNDRFELYEDQETISWLRDANISEDIVYSIKSRQNRLKDVIVTRNKYTAASEDFLVWLRQIKDNARLENLWNNLFYFYDRKMYFEEYLDVELSEDQMNFMTRLAKYAPLIIKNLIGLKLSSQIQIIEKVFDKFRDKPNTAISILESIKISDNVDIDDDLNVMIWEISLRDKVRKNEEKQKDIKILGENKNDSDEGDYIEPLPF